jgi:hypothetical protein
VDRLPSRSRGDGEEGIEPLGESFGVLLPELVLQEDAHGVHPDGFSQPQLAIVDCGVEGGSLKHLELVNSVGGNVVGAYEPGLTRIPGIGLFCSPAGLCIGGDGQRQHGKREGKRTESHVCGMIPEGGGHLPYPYER